jgi:hypothetical protein
MIMAQTPGPSRVERILEQLNRRRREASYVLFGVSALLAGLALWVGFGSDWEDLPETVGGALLAATALGAALWLLLSPPERITLSHTRLLALAVGGAAGLVISLATAWRAWLWRATVFTGGMEAWQGPQWWHLWVCILLELFGLALMFASLLLARTEERTSPVLRRLLYGYNTLLTGLLLLAILAVANVLAYGAFPGTYNWTKTRGGVISPRTKTIVRRLKDDVYFYVLLARGSRIYTDVKSLLDNFQTISERVKVETVNPDLQREDVEALRKRFPDLGRGLVISYGRPVKTNTPDRVIFIPEDRLFDEEDVGRRREPDDQSRTLVFKGENVLVTELSFLAGGRKVAKVYFTQDNQEPPLVPVRGRGRVSLSRFKSWLEEGKYSVRGLRLRKRPPGGRMPTDQDVYSESVPRDAAAVVIVNPIVPFSRPAAAALRKYVRGNGRLLILLGLVPQLAAPGGGGPQFVATKTGLETLLAEFNVNPEKACILRALKSQNDNPFKIRVTPAEESTNPIVSAMGKQAFFLDYPRPVRRLGRGGRYQADTLLEAPTDQNVFAETRLRNALVAERWVPYLQQTRQLQPSKEPIPVAQAVTDTQKDRPCAVVCGDMKLAMNNWLGQIEYSFLHNSLEWLLGKEPAGIAPQKSNRFWLNEADLNKGRMRYLPMFLIAIVIVGLGAGVWVVRRR